jgi:hypothetical protein
MMANKPLMFLVVVLVLAAGFAARLAYEQTTRPAQAQDGDPSADLDCADFDSQADAQAELRSDPSDPNALDEDDGADDGIACGDYPYDDPATDEIQVPEGIQRPGSQQDPRPQPDPRRSQQERERMPESGGLPGGALPVKPDGSCPAEFPVRHNNICLPEGGP